MTPRARPSLLRSDRATAGAEMALVAPMLIVLMFGSFELGNYFLSEHVVVKAVRDGARYASRMPIAAYSCPATVDSTVNGQIRNVTRTGQVASGGTARLPGWADMQGTVPTVTVTLSCTAITGGNYSGIYAGRTDVPKIKVRASVDYHSLFNDLGFTSMTLQMNAESEAAVMGI
jgi:Flp pilus assembly protein TadG